MTPLDDESALADAFRDSYVWWREACDDVWSAYSAWVDCESGEAALRFAAYESALDREETAAVIHHERARRLSALALERFRRRQAASWAASPRKPDVVHDGELPPSPPVARSSRPD